MDQAGPQMESIDIADNHLSGCERTTTTALHVGQTYICWCVHACLNTISQHWCGACVKNHTLAPHTERDRFMTCRCTSHFDSMGGIHAYTCMCVCSNCIMHVIPEHDIYISYYKQKNNPLLSQINLSCVVRQKVVMDPAAHRWKASISLITS